MASWRLPWLDSHQLADDSFQDTPSELLGFGVMFQSHYYFSSEWFKKNGIDSCVQYSPIPCIPNSQYINHKANNQQEIVIS